MKILISTFLISALSFLASAEKILFLTPFMAKSHSFWNKALMNALSDRGHSITALTSFPINEPNIKEFLIELNYDQLMDNFDLMYLMTTNPFWSQYFLTMDLATANNNDLNSNTSKELANYLKHEKFDLVAYDMTYCEWIVGFMGLLNPLPPIIGLSPFNHQSYVSWIMGNPENPAINPESALGFSQQMNLWQRIQNTLFSLLSRSIWEKVVFGYVNEEVNKFFNFTDFSMYETMKKTSLVLVNTNEILDGPRALLPNIIPVGGLHIQPPKPLAKDIEKFIQGSENGFIFFSLGTFVRSSSLDRTKIQFLLKIFAELPVRILWKYEKDDITELPRNVFISKWLPQNDILAHPKIKLFVTHSGLLSTFETLYHGVPVVSIPFIVDQVQNSEKMVRLGFGEKIDILKMTEETARETLNKVLSNPSYRKRAQELSRIYRNQPQTPMQRAVFWMEYVLQQKGAPYLRPTSVDMPWYQYMLIDVIIVILISMFSFFTFMFISVKYLYYYLYSKPVSKKIKVN